MKKEKKVKRAASTSSSDEDRLNVSEQEYALIKADVKVIKKMLDAIRKNIEAKCGLGEAGITKWYKAYDADGDQGVDLKEFIEIVKSVLI